MNTPSGQGLVNKGLAVINAAPCGDEATFAVVGLTRSGTSMLSSLLQEMGVFIGAAVDKAVYEDVEVARFIDSGDFEGLKTFIEKRDREHDVWGFKRPNAYRVLPKLVPMLRGPRIIVMFRDILAIAMRNHVSMQMDVISTLPRYVTEYAELVANISGLKCPMLLVSYEKFIQFPEESIERTAEFVGVEMTPELMDRALDAVRNGPEAYLQSSRLRYTGHVDRIVQGKLRGWAMVVDQPKVKANVHLRVNGKIVKNGVANRLRPDLVKAGIGDGHHGFEIDIGSAVTSDALIEVTAGNADFVLPNSGKKAVAYGLA
jgi:hypothetical protein